MTLSPKFIKRYGKNEFVIMPYKQYLQISEIIKVYEDLMDLRLAKEAGKNDIEISID